MGHLVYHVFYVYSVKNYRLIKDSDCSVVQSRKINFNPKDINYETIEISRDHFRKNTVKTGKNESLIP